MAPEQGPRKNYWGYSRKGQNTPRQRYNASPRFRQNYTNPRGTNGPNYQEWTRPWYRNMEEDRRYVPAGTRNRNYAYYPEWVPQQPWHLEEIPRQEVTDSEDEFEYNDEEQTTSRTPDYEGFYLRAQRRDAEILVNIAKQIQEKVELLVRQRQKSGAPETEASVTENKNTGRSHFSGMDMALALRPITSEQVETELQPFAGLLPLEGDPPEFSENFSENWRPEQEPEDYEPPTPPPLLSEELNYEVFEPITPEELRGSEEIIINYEAPIQLEPSEVSYSPETVNNKLIPEDEGGVYFVANTDLASYDHDHTGTPEIKEIAFPPNQITLYVSARKNAETQTEQQLKPQPNDELAISHIKQGTVMRVVRKHKKIVRKRARQPVRLRTKINFPYEPLKDKRNENVT